MIIFLLSNWRWLVPSAVAAVLAAWLGIVKVELADVRLANEHQKTEAADLLTKLTKANADKADSDALYARNLDEIHAQKTHEIAAAADSAERDFAERLRRISASRPRCPVAAAGGPSNPGFIADSAAGSSSGLLAEAARSLRETGESANRLAAIVRDECVPFASRYGR